MNTVEGIFLWLGVLGYIVAFVATLVGMVFGKERAVGVGSKVVIAAFAAHTLAIIARWIATGHMPVMGVYENSLLGAWFVTLVFFLSGKWISARATLTVIIVPIVLIMLGNGIMAGAELEPLAPVFQSAWLFVHVIFAWLAYGSFFIAAGLGAAFLWKGKAEAADGIEESVARRFPELDIMDNLIFRFIIFGFIADTIMIATGSIWAHGLWGRYWGWDAIETWSLVTWLIYGAALHLRITMGWKDKKMAWVAVGAITTVIVSFFGVGFISGVHTQLM
jgi:cytochrome c-type biogenesis protein CcsB